MRGARRIAVVVLSVSLAAGAARAQFVQYNPPGDFVSPAESREEQLESAMRAARWRLGRLLVDPWIALRQIGYQDDLQSGLEGERISDLTVTAGAGVNTYLPLGGDFVWGTFALPEYVWWQDLADRRRFNGRYGTGLFGNLGRIGVEATATRFDESRIFSREVEQQVNQQRDQGEVDLTVDLGKGLLLFARGTLLRFRSLEDAAVLAPLAGLDREERIVRTGVGVELGRGLKAGIGYEESEAEFEPAGLDRSNSGSAIVLDLEYDGVLFDLVGELARREVEPVADSEFATFEGTTADVSIAWRTIGPLRLETFGRRNVAYSIAAATSYFVDEGVGLGLTWSLGSTGSARFFYEQGELEYIGVEGLPTGRLDERTSYGARLSIGRGRVSLSLGASRDRYESNFPGADREFTRVVSSLGVGGGRSSPWG